MIIDYISDVHVNHWIPFRMNQLKWEKKTKEFVEALIHNKHGNVIVVAGDISEFNNQSIWVFEELAQHYEKVFYTFGNHDLYLLSRNQRKKYGDSIGRLENLIEESEKIGNVVPLIKSYHYHRGIKFAGDAMWYTPRTAKDWNFYHSMFADSKYIKIDGHTSEEVAKKLYKDSIEWYNSINGIRADVFVSHVPPVHSPFSMHEANGCYITAVQRLVSDVWICGHTHEQQDFVKAGTRFLMNALGYPSEHSFYGRVGTIPNTEVTDVSLRFGVKSFRI